MKRKKVMLLLQKLEKSCKAVRPKNQEGQMSQALSHSGQTLVSSLDGSLRAALNRKSPVRKPAPVNVKDLQTTPPLSIGVHRSKAKFGLIYSLCCEI